MSATNSPASYEVVVRPVRPGIWGAAVFDASQDRRPLVGIFVGRRAFVDAVCADPGRAIAEAGGEHA